MYPQPKVRGQHAPVTLRHHIRSTGLARQGVDPLVICYQASLMCSRDSVLLRGMVRPSPAKGALSVGYAT